MPRQDRTFRTPAIILKRSDFGEADRLLTLLTPNHGKRDAIAKGARKPTATKTGHVELFTRADMLISRGRNMDIVVQAEMVEPYLPLREDLQRGAYASYCAELLDRFIPPDDENIGEVFTLLDDTLQRLCTEDDIRLVSRYYEMHLLDMVGFRPELQECVYTRETIQAEDQFFSYQEGGVVNPMAGRNADGVMPISMVTLKMLRHMQRSPFSLVRTVQINPKLHTDLERILQGYITYLLERKLQSVDFIRRLRR
jgi:DNA repair protein RecO (recombination protein O)